MRAVLQTESAECGLACLAMVCGHHGSGPGLEELRRRFPVSQKGAALSDLIRAAGRLGFRSRPLRLELAELPRLRAPAILHWDLRHFVVLERAGRSRVTLLDPACGRRRLRYAEVSPHFTGVALELTPGATLEPAGRSPSVSLRQLTGPIRGLRRALGLLLLLSLALQVLVVLGPFFLQWVVDQVLVSADRDLLTVLAAGFAMILLLRTGLTVLRGRAVAFLAARLGLQWTGNVFAHLLKLPLEFFEKRHPGDILSRMGSLRTIQRTLSTSFVEALIDGLMAVVTLLMMLLYSRKLAAVSFAAVTLYALLRAATFRAMRDATERQLVAGARQQTHLLESLRGMPTVKVTGIEQEREAAYANLVNETTNQELGLAKLGLAFSGAGTLLFGSERIAVIWIGALLALDNVFSAGMLIAYLAYKDQFTGRVAGLINKGIELRMLRLHGERLADIVLAAPEREAPAAAPARIPASMRIEVRGVSFRYADGEPWVLEDLAFTVEEGEAVAIVGASGSGKTTLMKLLLALLRPTQGSIRVGGRDLGMLGAREYRRSVGAVMQDDRLFAGSIAGNIALGDSAADAARIEEAARLAAVHEEIAAMPMGYESLIGDMGTSLSGGQRQRVILARALYRRPRLLILDEATSHLDVGCERLVVEAVQKLALTRIVVAHRPQTAACADRILVLSGGRIRRELRGCGAARAANAAA